MNVDELLRERGDRWHTPDVNQPDLGAALGRSARRNGIARVAVAAVAVLAVCGTAWAVLPMGRGLPAIPAPAVTPSVPIPSTGHPATPQAITPDQLAEVARTLRADFRYPSATTATSVDVVKSTIEGVAAASVLPAPKGADAAAGVWVLQLKADFRCDTCRHPGGAVVRQPILRALVRGDLEVIAASTFDKPADLGTLGHVSTLSLDTDPPGFDEGRLRQSIRKALATVESVNLTHDMGVQTTSWRVQHALFGIEQDPRSYRSVWIVWLDGRFTCSTCTRLQDSATGKSLAIVIDSKTYKADQVIISTRKLDFGSLPGRQVLTWAPSALR